MKLTKTLLIILLSGLFGVFVQAQTELNENENAETESPKVAIEIDEFGREGDCQVSARVDQFLTQLQNNPGATGYIINYRSKDTLPAHYKTEFARKRIANFIRFRNFDESQFVFIDGGFRDSEAHELWLVPMGAVPPVPTEIVPEPELPEKVSFLYDKKHLMGEYGEAELLSEFVLPSVIAREKEEERLAEEQYLRENPNTEIEPLKAEQPSENEIEAEKPPTKEELEEERFSWVSEKFGGFLQNKETSQGIIIFYADNERYDVNKLQKFIEQGRARLAEKSEISAGKIKVIFGGYRTEVQIEFHVKPEKAKMPVPVPEERPKEEAENMEMSEAQK